MKFYSLLLLFFCATALSDTAPTHEPKSLAELQAQYRLLVDLRDQDEITTDVFKRRTDYLIELSEQKFDIALDESLIEQAVTQQRIDWVGSGLYILSAALVLVIAGPLIKGLWRRGAYLLMLLLNNPHLLQAAQRAAFVIQRYWEIWAYLALFTLLFTWHENEYVQLVFSFLFMSLFVYSVGRKGRIVSRESLEQYASWLTTIVWASLAYYFDNSFIGFIAVAALVGSLGFSLIAAPRFIAMGFADETRVLFATTSFFVISIISWLVFYTGYLPVSTTLVQQLEVYRVGLVSLVPLGYFVGIGSVSFYMYDERAGKKLLCEAFAFVTGLGVLAIALLYGIASMFWIGLFFMAWDLIDKYYRFIYHAVNWLVTAAVLSIILALGGFLLKSNMPFILETLSVLSL